MLDSPLETTMVFLTRMAGVFPSAAVTSEQAIGTEAEVNSQAGQALFFRHPKYFNRDRGFPDSALD